MSNEQLIFSYRDALKAGNEKEWVSILKDELVRRGMKVDK
ncbi:MULTISPECIES: sporulation histidine kinase inhibitor Sda [Niallia]|nr:MULTISPECIES: sporulation histidine kinase inhibitor Sda [Niallia]